jgi:hypothetical protein
MVQATAERQAAMEVLIMVATSGGPTMFARIGNAAGTEPARRARFQSRPQRDALGKAEIEEGRMKS